MNQRDDDHEDILRLREWRHATAASLVALSMRLEALEAWQRAIEREKRSRARLALEAIIAACAVGALLLQFFHT